MRLMLIDHYAGSGGMGPVYRGYYLARYWREQGHQVTVVCASFSQLRDKNPAAGERERVEDAIEYLFLPTPTCTRRAGCQRNRWSFVWQLYRQGRQLARRFHPDVVLCSSGYALDTGAAARIARLAGGRFVYELRELGELFLKEQYRGKGGILLGRLSRSLQRRAAARADAVTSTILHADHYLGELGVHPRAYYYVPNAAYPPQQESGYPKAHIETLEGYRREGRFVVAYLGDFGDADRADLLVESAKKLTSQIQFVLIGNGGEKCRLRKQVAQAHLSNVHFLEPVAPGNAAMVLCHADCLYMGTRCSAPYGYGYGMERIYSYLLAGRPVILAAENQENPVGLSGGGVVIGQDRVMEVIRGIGHIRNLSPQQREEMGRKGREFCAVCYDSREIGQRYLELLEELAAGELPGEAVAQNG